MDESKRMGTTGLRVEHLREMSMPQSELSKDREIVVTYMRAMQAIPSHHHPVLRWGILGWGRIARQFANALAKTPRHRCVAIASRSAAPQDIPAPLRVHDYDALLARDDVDAVYIALPHTMHSDAIIAAAQQGKGVLCEKPFAINRAESMRVWDALKAAPVTFMEGWMFRFHPQLHTLLSHIAEGRIGSIQSVEAVFGGDHRTLSRKDRLWDPHLAAGAVLDIGGYPMALACWLASAAAGNVKGWVDPEHCSALSRFHAETCVDIHSCATLRFPGGWIAKLDVACDMALQQKLRIVGSSGCIEMTQPFSAGTHDSSPAPQLRINSVDVPLSTVNPYAAQSDAFADAFFAGNHEVAQMPWAHSEALIRNLDRWRGSAGIVYPWEKASVASIHATRAKELRHSVSVQQKLKQRHVNGLDKPLSSLVMGVDFKFHYPSACALFDLYVESGGNVFDTAHYYDVHTMLGHDAIARDATLSDSCEAVLGTWIQQRGVRDDIVLISKGAHSPCCYPDAIERELYQSLERLGLAQLDIYLMHRDNPAVPVGEFVDALNRIQAAGLTRCIGVSNWQQERMIQAQAYAHQHGLKALQFLSNQFSLAVWQGPMWPGCVNVQDQRFRQWLAQVQLPLLAWSSQAQGFFARSEKDLQRDEALASRWLCDLNRERKARAAQLAARHGHSINAVALAYVTHQAFPSFALIGSRTMEELRASLSSATLELSSDEIEWLEQG